jgi:hypothetical protein
MYLSIESVVQIVSESIDKRYILLAKYQHVNDHQIVNHKIAPFDIGSTNPNPTVRARNADNLYAYSFTHIDDKLNVADPKVCVFNIRSFINLWNADETFDENELTRLNLARTKYDYRNCRFALRSDRDWYRK